MGTDGSTQGVLTHHLQAFGEGNLDAIMSDYGDDSVVFTPDAVLQGLAEIKPLFEAFFAEFSKPGMSFNMDTQVVRGEVAYIVWRAETADNHYELATDTFVVRDGKIVYQTFAAKITPKG